MKTIILLITLLTVIGLCADYDMISADLNELHLKLTNFGIIAHDISSGNAGAYWPTGYFYETYIYGSGIWIGGIIDTAVIGSDTLRDTLVSVGYNPNSGSSEMCPGYGDETSDPLERVYNSRNDWPPMNPDSSIVFDSIISFHDTYCFFSDMDSSQHFTDENLPLGITVKQHSYQWAGPLLEDVVIIKLTVKNERSDGKSVNNCYIAYTIDADIGNESGSEANDLLGFIDTLSVEYAGNPDTLMQINTGYQFQLESEGGWAHDPGIFSTTLLESPIATENIDLYHDGSYIIPAGSPIGMTSFGYFSLATDPGTKEERYQVLAGYNHLTFDPSSPENSYDPFPSWGEGTAGYPGQSENEMNAGDKRNVVSCGPFTLSSGDSIVYVIALIINETPDEIVPHSLLVKNFWENRIPRISLINPPDSSLIIDTTAFEWQSDSILDSFALCLTNNHIDTSITIKGLNTFSHDLNIFDMPDGYYKWQVWNYSYSYTGINSPIRNLIIDRPDMNYKPVINLFTNRWQSNNLIFNWNILDVDDDVHQSSIVFVNLWSDGDTLYTASTSDDSLVVNAGRLLPNGYYRISLISADDESAKDSAYIHMRIDLDRPADTIPLLSGDNNILTLRAEVVHPDSVKLHDYYVIFDNPWYYESGLKLSMPFTVFDSTAMSEILCDTAHYSIFFYNQQLFYTDMFDGINLELTFNGYSAYTDSIVIENDAGYSYPDSVLMLDSLSYPVMGGRDIIIEWQDSGDTVYPLIYCENYPANIIPFDPDSFQFGYSFKNIRDTVFTQYADTGSYQLIIGENKINGHRTPPSSRPYYGLFDTLPEIPETGEIWRVYNSGDRTPIKGDVYGFRPSGIPEKKLSDSSAGIIFPKLITGRSADFRISGNGASFDVSIYNIEGRKIKHLYSGSVTGSKIIHADMDMPPGIYFVKDRMNPDIYDSKFIILR